MKNKEPTILVTEDAAILSRDERRVHPIERDMLRRADRVVTPAEAARMAREEEAQGHEVVAEGPDVVDPFLIPLTPAKMMKFAGLATMRNAECEEIVTRLMTPPLASIVRKLRVTEGFSWRLVASQMVAFFHADMTPEERKLWQPASNQIMGAALCAVAARSRGERHDLPPWN